MPIFECHIQFALGCESASESRALRKSDEAIQVWSQDVQQLLMEVEEDKKKSDSSKMRVRVAIRIRPMNAREEAKEQSTCIMGYPGNRLVIGTDRQFKFDSVFTQNTAQQRVYRECVQDLVLGCFEGYNAAVLAYGQTGSGKTFTMGTSNVGVSEEEMGIIPRVIGQLFAEIEKKKSKVDFVIKVSFLEIYNEQIIDLLGNEYLLRDPNDRISSTAAIREQKDGSISIYGICQQKVETAQQMFALLEKGATHRSTACTLMNDASSRSHAIFTIFIQQHFIEDLYKNNPTEAVEEGFVTAKFHFVDLAGSERIKKTGATGSTLREGININMGLLCLGNVISALTDPEKKGAQRFVPYRDSKLTRILQDSLGGNSNTYMIACVSPAQSNYQESLSTLKYAARAMNIKNTPVVNRDPQSALISQLKQKLFEAQTENKRMRAMLGQSGMASQELLSNLSYKPRDQSDDVSKQEAELMKRKVLELEQKITTMTEELLSEKNKANGCELEVLQTRRDRDLLRLQIDDLMRDNPFLRINPVSEQRVAVLEAQLQTIQIMKNQMIEKDLQYGQLQAQYEKILLSAKRDEDILVAKTKEVYELKKQVIQLHKNKRRTEQQYSRPDQNTLRMSFYQGQPQNTSMLNQSFRMNQSFRSGYPDNSLFFQNGQSYYEGDSHILSRNNSQFFIPTITTERTILDDPSHLAQDHIFLHESHQFQQQNENCHAQLNTVSGEIKQRQRMLKEMTNAQIDLEYQLINSMKEEYYKKINGLEKEKDKLEKELANVAKNKDEKIQTMVEKDKTVQALKGKKEQLEAQLKEFRKKQREQQGLEKMVQDQKGRIGDLNKEIKSFKLQKLELNKKMKEDKEKFQKFRSERYKELMLVKKSYIQKDNELKRMTKQTNKTHEHLLKKQEEAKQLKKVNDTLRQILEPKPKPFKRSTFNPASALQHSAMNYENVVSRVVDRMQLDIERQIQYEKYAKELKSIQTEIDQFLTKDCKLKVELERLSMRSKLCVEEIQRVEIDDQINDIHGQVNELSMIMEGLQQKLQFTKSKLSHVFTSDLPKIDIDMEVIYNKAYDSIDCMRRFVRLFFQKLMSTLEEQNHDKKYINQLKQEVQSLNSKLQQMDEQIIRMNIQHQQSLTQLRQQLLMANNSQMQQQPQSATLQVPALNVSKKQDVKDEKKFYERKINDLNKKVKQLTLESEKLRMKCDVVTSKYQNVKKLGNKDKFIGVTDEIKIPTLKEKRQERSSITPIHNSTLSNINNSSMLLDEVNDLWSGLNTSASVSSLARYKSYQQRRLSQTQEVREQANRWDCLGTLQGHTNPILSITNFSNCLFSTSMKNLKMWDIQTRKLISDVGGQHLNGYVKAVIVDPERKLLVTACEKNLALWDFINMKVVETFKGHKDQIRALHMHNGLLFSGGKGTGNSPSLLTWDFRSNTPVDEKQRNQDIFSMASYKNTLYYGTRNHQVRRMNLENTEVLAPFQNPHFDAVTGLSTLNNYLISGSKDKNLKLWNLDVANNNYRFTSYGHNDYINCVVRDNTLPIFYSGSKDGHIKAGVICKEKIQVVGSVNCHSQSVNTLCSFDENTKMCGFATGSSDKTIKLWKASTETVENIQSQLSFESS